MNALRRTVACFIFFILSLCYNPINVFADKTANFYSLTPNLQYVMRKYGEYQKTSCGVDRRSPEEIAEWRLDGKNVEIDGSYCYKGSYQYPLIRPKLTNEDIESLNNLKKMRSLTLSDFDLSDVDVTKFLDINNGGKIEFVCLSDCDFAESDDVIEAQLARDGYTLGGGCGIWFTWPGVDPDKIFNER